MSIYATIFDLDDDGHHPGVCAVWAPQTTEPANQPVAVTSDGRRWVRVDAACTCGNLPPLIYRGSHINPSEDDPRGGALLACGIPDHCHPDARGRGDDTGYPVPFLRLSMFEDPATYQSGGPGEATLVLDLKQVTWLRDTLTEWIDSRAVEKREDDAHVPD